VQIRKFAAATSSGFALAALALAGLPAAGAAAQPGAAAADPGSRHACPASAVPGWAECLALVRRGVVSFGGRARDATPAGYGPAQLQRAYNLTLASAAAGKGETIAVVDAFDDPDAAADLAVYRAHYHLPACGAGCFRKVNQEGKTSPLPKRAGDTGWAIEESLDLDMVSAICPRCHILLVEARNSADGNLGKAVDAAVADGARFVSNSYSSPETPAEASSDGGYYRHPGVAVTAAAGDSGYGVGYPAASPYVTSVGGTTLRSSRSAARGWTETVWDNGSGATGSGCSRYEPKPSWQTDTGCAGRTDNDVAADANPSTGAAVYDSYEQGGWLEAGGTSEASPIVAAVYALAGAPGAGSYPAEFPYRHTAGLHDITSGSDGSCGASYLCTAEVGYDGPTGWGTPDGTAAFQAVDHPVVVARLGSRRSSKGVRIIPVRVRARVLGPGSALTFSAAGLPPGLKVSRRGVIYGRPRAAGSYVARVRATDATGMTGSATLRWTVRPVR
jgi:Putative Ig domain/Subtilase family